MSYEAIVCRIKTYPHPNADKIQLGMAQGSQVVIGLDIKDQQLGVFFPSDGALTDEFCTANNLYPIYDENGKKTGGGFIDPKQRRVKAQTFRGQRSEGFWLPLSHFTYTGYPLGAFREGYTFTSLNGHEICYKYVVPSERLHISHFSSTGYLLGAFQGRKILSNKKELTQLPMHLETKKFRYEVEALKHKKNCTFYVTEKLHGTSGRTGYVQVERKKTWWMNLLEKYLKIKIDTNEYQLVTGTRQTLQFGYSGRDSYRYLVSDVLAPFIKKGESVYYEILGYKLDGGKIQHDMSPKAVDKEFAEQWGDSMNWCYGRTPESPLLVAIYNWTLITETGTKFTYPWDYITYRVNKIAQVLNNPKVEVITVPMLHRFTSEDLNIMNLSGFIELLTEQPSTFNTCYREGVCIRVERNGTLYDIYKNKSFPFRMMEQGNKDKDIIDIEETEG
jgi:hypothetical protein